MTEDTVPTLINPPCSLKHAWLVFLHAIAINNNWDKLMKLFYQLLATLIDTYYINDNLYQRIKQAVLLFLLQKFLFYPFWPAMKVFEMRLETIFRMQLAPTSLLLQEEKKRLPIIIEF